MKKLLALFLMIASFTLISYSQNDTIKYQYGFVQKSLPPSNDYYVITRDVNNGDYILDENGKKIGNPAKLFEIMESKGWIYVDSYVSTATPTYIFKRKKDI